MGARPLISFLKQNAAEKANEQQEEPEAQVEAEVTEEPAENEAVTTFKREYAQKLGWTPKEDWEQSGRDTTQWRDFDEFLNTSPAYFEKLRKISREQKQKLERSQRANEAALEEERRLSREDAQREAREAAAAGDGDRAAAAVAKAASGPPPETTAWIVRNSWFNEDKKARALAAAEVEEAASAGKTIKEQLQAAEDAVKKRFPEYFEDTEEDELPEFITKPVRKQEAEVRMSNSDKIKAAASVANTGARVRDVKSNREKGFKDLPADVQKTYEATFARKFANRGLSVDDAKARYAKNYFGNS